jgi:catechol 2,3-dioxygenase-like lactoylglutathione lyase family enzyme
MATDRFDHVFVEPASFDASLAFYRDALGWTERFAWGGNGEPRGVSLASSGGAAIVLAEPHPAADHSKSHGINGTRPTLHLMVDDIEARHAELAAKGAALFAPEATHWGTRWFVARDPDGNLIAFEQRQ